MDRSAHRDHRRRRPERAHYILERMVDETRRAGGHIPFQPTTAYVNTIPPHMEAKSPGDAALEWKIRAILRWNAMATVVRANRKPGELGGHISSFASSATLYDVGFNHFWRAPNANHPGDLLYIQGHSAPGHLRTCVPRRSSERGAARQLPHGSRRARAYRATRIRG
jgi:pyruvate dehydrogenase E1 component